LFRFLEIKFQSSFQKVVCICLVKVQATFFNLNLKNGDAERLKEEELAHQIRATQVKQNPYEWC